MCRNTQTNADYDLEDNHYNDISEQIDLVNYINQLGERERNVLIRRYLMGYTDAEIGDQLQISRQAVCKMKNKALRKLELMEKK